MVHRLQLHAVRSVPRGTHPTSVFPTFNAPTTLALIFVTAETSNLKGEVRRKIKLHRIASTSVGLRRHYNQEKDKAGGIENCCSQNPFVLFTNLMEGPIDVKKSHTTKMVVLTSHLWYKVLGISSSGKESHTDNLVERKVLQVHPLCCYTKTMPDAFHAKFNVNQTSLSRKGL
jgi:hypothetical protein